MTAPSDSSPQRARSPRRTLLRRLALGVLLALSLAGNVVLGRQVIADVRKAHVARLDPAELDMYAADRGKAPPPGRPVLVFFGDSRSLMWPTPAALTGYTVVNRGVGYQTTAQIALRVDADVAPLHPAVVVLEAGVNDLKVIADAPDRRARVVADCEANLRGIVERLRAMGATVVLVSVFDMGDIPVWRAPFWSDEVPVAIREVNAFLPTLVRDGVVLLEAGSVLDDEHGKVKPAYQLDFIHLAAPGYAALDERLVPLVRALPQR